MVICWLSLHSLSLHLEVLLVICSTRSSCHLRSEISRMEPLITSSQTDCPFLGPISIRSKHLSRLRTHFLGSFTFSVTLYISHHFLKQFLYSGHHGHIFSMWTHMPLAEAFRGFWAYCLPLPAPWAPPCSSLLPCSNSTPTFFKQYLHYFILLLKTFNSFLLSTELSLQTSLIDPNLPYLLSILKYILSS